ncbi:exonuclease [Candidatus Nitrososphaera sp. FF02]|uniref:exonuclease n=1 Tax=Candidatus Nitrososphaera sp. FF02 TaxID=3398226 RepID=UPI0039EA71E0
MPSTVFHEKSGITVRHGDTTIALDPSRPADSHFTFVSHAHVDHLHRKGKSKSKLLVSKETSLLASARGYSIEGAEEHDGFALVDTGHILGSRGLLIGDDVYYTGDLSIRERAFMKPAKMPRARTLIIESTFGLPGYRFPAVDEVTHRVNKVVSELYDMGIPVILMGYALGKAQLLTKLFGHWDPVYVHDSVAKMNSVYSDLGVSLKSAMSHSEAEERGLLAGRKPWIMIAPLMSGRSAFVKEMKEKYGAVTVGFSGWALDNNYRYRMGLDYAFPMSDHCDYPELVEAIKACAPEKVYTFHGFAEEFAQSLKKMGFDAEPVERKGRAPTLDSFS